MAKKKWRPADICPRCDGGVTGKCGGWRRYCNKGLDEIRELMDSTVDMGPHRVDEDWEVVKEGVEPNLRVVEGVLKSDT